MADEYDENGDLILTESYEILGAKISEAVYLAIGNQIGAVISSPELFEIEVEIDENYKSISAVVLADAIRAVLKTVHEFPGYSGGVSLGTESKPWGWLITLKTELFSWNGNL